jgi:hypothetical protein
LREFGIHPSLGWDWLIKCLAALTSTPARNVADGDHG